MKLQTKILLPIMMLIVLLCGLSGFMSYRNAADDLQIAIEDNLRGKAEALGRAMNTMMKSLFVDAGRIAQRNVILNFYRNASSGAAQKNILNDLKLIEASYPAFDRVHLLDDKGVVIASTDSGNIGKSYADRAYFKAAMKGEVFLNPPIQSRLTGKGVMVASAPVTLDGKIVGAIYCPVPLEYLYQESVAPITVGNHGYAYVLDRNGLVVAHKDPKVLFKDSLNGMEHYKAMGSADKDGVHSFVGAAKSRVIAYHAKEPLTGLVAVAQAEHADVFEGLAHMRNNSMMVAGAGILLAAIMIMLILRPVLRDIKAGMVFAEQVAAGDLSGTLAVSRKDELGMLGNALRAIPESLKKIVAEYQQLEKNIEGGNLGAEGDATHFSGEFANLINGTNAILKRFVAIVDAIPSPTLMLDKNLKVRYMNTVGQKLTGADYDGKTCDDLFRSEDYGTERCALARSTASGKPCESETVIRPGGHVMEISYTAIPLFDPQGKLASILLLMIDLTQIKSTQRTIVEVATQALEISNRVAAASEQLSAQVEQVSRGTDVQRDRVNSTATAMEEMNATVLEVAHSAGQASEQAESMRGKATHGAELVDNVIAAVQRVHSVAGELQGNMRELGSQAEAIGGVMNVISDIADQTNLLALNAAIEAARAGDAGRGFAVVADEVRKLAEKTMGATTEVGSSIKGIQHSATSNIQRVDEAGKSVAEATELAGTSGAALKEIVTLAGENSSLIASIATAAEEQSATSEEINRSVEEINRIAGEAATGMNESASAVQELSRMAMELKALLDKLKA